MDKFFIRSIIYPIIIGFMLTSCGRDDNEPEYDPPYTSSFKAPTGVSGKVVSTGVMLSWNPVDDAEFYVVDRSISLNGTVVGLGYIGDVGKVYNTSVIDTKPLDGDNYYFIRACKDYDGHSYTISSKSAPVYVQYFRNDNPSGGNDNPGGGNDNPNGGNDNPNGGNTQQKPAPPTGVSVSNEGNNYIPDVRVRWNSVSNATSYYIYKSSSASGSYSKIGESSYAQYGFSDPNPPTNGKSAYYKVKAVNNAGESAYSDYAKYTSNSNDTSFAPATPNVKTSGTSTINVSWTCATGSNYGQAKSYEVYKRNPNTAEFELMTTTKSTSWSDYNPHPGINRYGIIAVNDAGKSSVGLGASNEVPLSRPSSFNATKSGSDVKFTWSKVSGATGYQIFESSSASGSYFILDQIDDGSTTTHTRYYPAQGTTKYFKIRAVYSAQYGGSPIYSDFSSYKSVTF